MYKNYFGLALLLSGVPASAQASEDWTGAYAGAYADAGSERTSFEDFGCWTSCTQPNLKGTSLNAGGTLGFDIQASDGLVIGAVADIGTGGERELFAGATIGVPTQGVISWHSKTDWQSTIRGRVGFSSGDTLIFVSGGAAFAKAKFSTQGRGVPTWWPNHSQNFEATWQGTLSGRSYGVGIERKFGDVAAKVELLQTDYGHASTCFANSDGVNAGVCWRDNLAFAPLVRNSYSSTNIRIGLNYRF